MWGSKLECEICFNRYDDIERIPKNTGCGHLYCLRCLRDTRSATGTLYCPRCRKLILRRPEELETNHTILSEATSEPTVRYYCDNCKKDACWECERSGHLLKNMGVHRTQQSESARQAVRGYAEVLEKMMPKLLGINDITDKQVKRAAAEQETTNELARYFTNVISENGIASNESRWQAKLCDAGKYSVKLAALERGLPLLMLEKGTCQVTIKPGDGAPAQLANLDLSAIALERPEVLLATQYLMSLLSMHGYLQENIQGAAAAARSQGSAAGRRHQGRQGQGGQGDARDAPWQNPASDLIKEDGSLDLAQNGVGSAGPGEMAVEKNRLLQINKPVTQLRGLDCSRDPKFSTNLILKHASHLNELDVRMILQEQYILLSSMRVLQHLKIRGTPPNQSRLSLLPPQSGCVLKSLYMSLPLTIQWNLWEAFASSSLMNVTLRLEVASAVDAHVPLKKYAAKTPNLRTIHLLRKIMSEHTLGECEKQVRAIMSVVPTSVNVTCSVCKHASSE